MGSLTGLTGGSTKRSLHPARLRGRLHLLRLAPKPIDSDTNITETVMKRGLRALGLLTCLLCCAQRAAAETAPTAEQLSFFEKKIRPVLATHCYKCHAA